jgi:hypothetical protein
MTISEIMARVDLLAVALRELTDQQLRLIEIVVAQFRRPFIKIERTPVPISVMLAFSVTSEMY